jgi:Family of unknown function (DUF6221)
MDLTAFVTARLDEEYLAAYMFHNDSQWAADMLARLFSRHESDPVIHHIARYDPARALREVEAGRIILARYADTLARMEDDDYPAGVARDQAREYEDFVLPCLATAWSDHPDYDPDWAP